MAGDVQSQSLKRRRWPIIVGGCIAAVLLGCIITSAAGAALYFSFRERFESAQPTVAYILDTSPRMREPTEEGVRLDLARGVLAEIVRPSNPVLTSGLRVFGSGAVAVSCEDTELVVPLSPSNQRQIASQLGTLEAGSSSDAALAEAMVAAIRDMTATDGPHSLVVVTGGDDGCSPQAGQFVAQEAERAGISLQTYVVGYGVTDEQAQAIKGIVEQTPGATYHQADNAEELRNVLNDIQGQIDREATVAVARATLFDRLGQGDLPELAASEADEEPAPGPVGGETTTGATACDHPYMPLRSGATWAYGGGQSFTWVVTGVSGGQNSATASLTIDFGEGQLNYEWLCDQQGIKFYYSGGFISDEMGELVQIEMVSGEGTSLPPADQLVPGAAWSSAYTWSYSFEMEGIGGTAFTTDVVQDHSFGGTSSVSTSAGTFEAVSVHTSGTNTTSLGFAEDTSSSFSSTTWFARDVGIVRMEYSTGDGESYSLDLVSYSIP